LRGGLRRAGGRESQRQHKNAEFQHFKNGTAIRSGMPRIDQAMILQLF
jgi:hypothetical protein